MFTAQKIMNDAAMLRRVTRLPGAMMATAVTTSATGTLIIKAHVHVSCHGANASDRRTSPQTTPSINLSARARCWRRVREGLSTCLEGLYRMAVVPCGDAAFDRFAAVSRTIDWKAPALPHQL